MVQTQFCGLHERLLSELKEKEVSVDQVLDQLTFLPIQVINEYESLIQKMLPTLEETTRIATLFRRLNPLFRFIDYGLLNHLISKFGSKELKEDMTSYVDRVTEFMHETTVGEIMDCFPGDTEARVDYSKLKVKFKDDPKTYTLERLNNFRRQFCSRVRLSEFISGLISLEPAGSFFATWLIPTVVVSELMKVVREIDQHFCELERIVSISVDQEQLYPLTDKATPSAQVSASVTHSPLSGDLIVPTPSLVSSVVKKTEDLQLKSSAGDSVNIITIGWDGGPRHAHAIIGQNINNTLKLWDFSEKQYRVPLGIDNEEFRSRKMEELWTSARECPTIDLVLIFEDPVHLICKYYRSQNVPDGSVVVVSLTTSDLTKLFGRSVWGNAIIVRPFTEVDKGTHLYKYYLEAEPIDRYSPEVVSNIPIVPINVSRGKLTLLDHIDWLSDDLYATILRRADLYVPTLPDRIDWLSPLWDTCLLRMKETAQNSFLKANADRIKLSTTGEEREDSDIPLDEQPIFYVPGQDTSNAPIRSAVSKLLKTEVAGPLGTTEPTQVQPRS